MGTWFPGVCALPVLCFFRLSPPCETGLISLPLGKGKWTTARPRFSRESCKQSDVSSPCEAVGPEKLMSVLSSVYYWPDCVLWWPAPKWESVLRLGSARGFARQAITDRPVDASPSHTHSSVVPSGNWAWEFEKSVRNFGCSRRYSEDISRPGELSSLSKGAVDGRPI